jgi:hypothetical protein
MPNVTISWNRSAGDSNYIYGMPGGTIGPDSGSRTVNVGYGQTYNLTSSGSGPGYTALRRLNSQSLGLDDRQGAGADNDFNDMIIYVSGGTFTGDTTYVGPSAIYGCMDSSATNYNSNANVNSGCVYANPNPTLTVNGQTSAQTIVEGDNITINWTANDTAYISSASITGLGSLSNNQFGQGSFTVSPSQSTVYTFTTNYPPNNSQSSSLTVNVKEIPEITASFIGGNTITRGNSATLEWSITGSVDNLTISPNLGSQNLTGQVTVSPTTTTTYTLYASSPGYGGRLQDTVSVELTVIQPPSASMVVPSTIDWGDSSYEVQFSFTEVVSYDLTVEYTDLDGVMTTHPALTGANPTITTTNLLIADETASSSPKWNNRGYSSGKIKLKAYGSGSLFVEIEQIFNINIDQMPDSITIPSTEDVTERGITVITPNETVTTDELVISDVDIAVEITADSPIQVEIDQGGVWYNVRQRS